MCSYVKKAIGNIARENGDGTRAAPQTDRKPHHVTPDDGRKKKRAEESAGVALRASGEIELRAGGVDHHAPFGDAQRVCQQITDEHGEEASERNPRERGTQRRKRQEVKQQTQDDQRRQPARDDD